MHQNCFFSKFNLRFMAHGSELVSPFLISFNWFKQSASFCLEFGLLKTLTLFVFLKSLLKKRSFFTRSKSKSERFVELLSCLDSLKLMQLTAVNTKHNHFANMFTSNGYTVHFYYTELYLHWTEFSPSLRRVL